MPMGGGGGGGGYAGAIEAGKAVVRLNADDAGLRSALDRGRRMVLGWGKSLAKVGGAMFGAGIVPLATAFVKSMDSLTDIAKMENAARAMGMTSEAASGLFGMLAQNGGEFKEDLEGLTQFAQRIQDALSGVGGATGEAAKLFQGLSVSAKDLEGLAVDEQFYRIHEAIRELPQGMQMAKLSLIGGTDSMKKWLPLLAKSTKELREQAKASSMSADDMGQARDTVMAYQRATLSMTQAWRQVAIALAPTISMISEKAVPAFQLLAKFFKQNRELIVSLAAGFGILAGAGAALLALGTSLAAISFAIGGIISAVSAAGTVIAAVFSPVGLGVAAIAVATTALIALAAETETFWQVLGYLGDTWNVVWTEVSAVFNKTWGGIKDAFAAGDLKLAFEVGAAGITVLWKETMFIMTVAWNKFKSDFVDGWHAVMTEVEVLFYRVLGVFQREMGNILSKLPRGVRGALGTMAPMLGIGMGIRMKSEEEIRAAAEKAQADRNAARAADEFAAMMEVLTAKGILQGKVDEAFRAKYSGAIGNLAVMMLGLGRGAHKKLADAEAGFNALGSARGGFGGRDAGLRFGIGDVQQKQLNELTKANDKLDKIAERVGGVPVD